MLWAVGTGRCGTRSLADWLGGIHEPRPWLEDEPVRYYCDGDLSVKDVILERLVSRRDMNYPAISDLKHSYVIDLICEIDSDAEFIWLIREPVACVSSLINGGAWTKTDWHGERKWRPDHGWTNETREEKAVQYWLNVNRIIEEGLIMNRKRIQVLLTQDIPVKSNVHSVTDRVSDDVSGLSECRRNYHEIITEYQHWRMR